MHRDRVTAFCAGVALAGCLLAAGALAPGPAAAQGTAAGDERERRIAKRLDQSELVRLLKEAIVRDLVESGYLKEQLDLAVQDYFRRQESARAEADAERAREAAKLAKNVRRVSAARDHVYGNPEAEVSLIEYSDFECPFCKSFHPTAKALVEAYGGKVNWVYRHFPLAFHNPGAEKQAEAAECAGELGGNDAFWRFTDAVYERTESNGNGFPLTGLTPLAREIGLDADAFRTCFESGRHAARVKEDLAEGASVGVTGTPGNILLNNRTGEVRVLAGALPAEAFHEEIDDLLR